MNIFVLDRCQDLAAQMHCDKHVVKMILETAQILATVHHHYGNGSSMTYKPTHKNHPCVVWATVSPEHYRWLHRLGLALCTEYTYRYGKTHKCEALFHDELSLLPTALKCKSATWSDPPQCMPDEYKHSSVVEAYQTYYREAKAAIAKWTGRAVPKFMFHDAKKVCTT